jgi:hypothetical protein
MNSTKEWTLIKNHQEMRNYIMKTIPQLIYNDEFLELLTDIEMKNLIDYKISKAKTVVYSA